MPWWIWVAGSIFMLLVVVVFIVKYQRHDDEVYRPYRTEGSSRRRRSSRSRSRHRRSE